MKTEDKIKNYLAEISQNDKQGKKINAFLQLNDNALLEAKEVDSKLKQGKAPSGKLVAGLAIAVKSNINVLGMNASCASRTLENYTAPYNATVISRIKNAGGIIIGMTNMDEFACGSSGETSAFGACRNPACLDRIPGGSSSGSAAAVAAGFCDAALGSDTGGSIRNPASHCGVIGFKPSYGTVSRYGLIDLSMSLDQIGVLARDIATIKLVFEVIKGRDARDATSLEIKGKTKLGKIKIGLPWMAADEKIWKLINDKVREIVKKNSWSAREIKMNYVDLGVQTYYPINYVEFFSGTRKFDGRRYGKKIEDSCGEEVLRRILGGSEIAKAEHAGRYYKKALQAKKLIEQEFEKAFKEYDCLIMPAVPKLPHKLGSKISVEDMYAYDSLTALANLAEIPAISMPCGKIDGVPAGLQILCPKLEDEKLLEIAERFE